VIVFTGEDTEETGWSHGTTTVSSILYEQLGYDVHLHSEEESVIRNGDPSGEAHAINEIVNALEFREVHGVAIIGYSHGGGSTYDVAVQLEDMQLDPPFVLDYSAYIDAIEDESDIDIDPETRLPGATLFHVNLYQPFVTPVGPLYNINEFLGTDIGVHGASVIGSHIDMDVNEDPPDGLGLFVDHSSIDDAIEVHDLILMELKDHVER